MKRRLSPRDRFLSGISQALAATASSQSSGSKRASALNQADLQTLRGHQAMNSAASAWLVGRQMNALPMNASEAQISAIDSHSRALGKTLDDHEGGRSLLLPVLWAGAFGLGCMTQLSSSRRTHELDADIIRRANIARSQSQASLDTANETSSPAANSDKSEPHTADKRRSQYSLRAGHSPSGRLLQSIASRAYESLFKLTEKI